VRGGGLRGIAYQGYNEGNSVGVGVLGCPGAVLVVTRFRCWLMHMCICVRSRCLCVRWNVPVWWLHVECDFCASSCVWAVLAWAG
jgi:hypothetical protein